MYPALQRGTEATSSLSAVGWVHRDRNGEFLFVAVQARINMEHLTGAGRITKFTVQLCLQLYTQALRHAHTQACT